MQKTYVLTKMGSDHITDIGTKSEMCDLWGRLKYSGNITENYSVKEVEIAIGKELTKEEIDIQIEEDYNKYH